MRPADSTDSAVPGPPVSVAGDELSAKLIFTLEPRASPVAQTVKNLPALWEKWVQPLGWEDPLQKGMATHFSILAWRIPRTEEPGNLQSMGSQRVRHDWVANPFISLLEPWYFSDEKQFLEFHGRELWQLEWGSVLFSLSDFPNSVGCFSLEIS